MLVLSPLVHDCLAEGKFRDRQPERDEVLLLLQNYSQLTHIKGRINFQTAGHLLEGHPYGL